MPRDAMEGLERTRCCGRQPALYGPVSILREWSQKAADPLSVGTVRCGYCGTLSMDPMPAAAQMAAHFADMGYRDPDQEEARRRQKTATYEAAAALARQAHGAGQAPLRACDFGSAQGHGLDALSARGFEVCGVELDPTAVRHSQGKGHAVYEGADLSALANHPPLDALFLIDVLYYVPAPFDLLQAAYRHLRPGGVLVVRMSVWGGTAHAASRMGRWSARLRLHASALLCDHVVAYSPRSFRAALERAGYQVLAEQVDASFSHLRRERGWHWYGLQALNPIARLLTGGRLHLLPSPIFVAQRPNVG